MALELEGKIFQILAEESGIGNQSNKAWRKQSFVIETEEQYPKKVCFTSWNETVDGLKSLRTGEKVRVSFRVESREYNGKWYTDAVAWKITKIIEETLTNKSAVNTNTNEVIYAKDSQQTKDNTINNFQNITTTDETPFVEDDEMKETGDDLPF